MRVEFQDSSVPPQYHRSYVLTVEGGEAHVVVDSYGTVVHDERSTVPTEVWQDFVAGLDHDLAAIGEPTPVEPCPGGTSLSVAISSGSRDFHRALGSCGPERNEAITHALQDLVAPLDQAVDLERLTATD
ncbi:SEA domain-containing protein [Aquihabitans sp. G128]|uniref:SEA domain-containing protein n=1 Tax=Aquihabitans sp. G128 TaxID=2849779 RepID=UPI001C23F7D9|nr:SEA domain-containing protein [Aquihabitans sp. G128]QXC62998.1 SEA domain-containing protein [Aquihabitans sp. G128]